MIGDIQDVMLHDSLFGASTQRPSILGTNSVSVARQMRNQRERDVKQLHTRIAVLQAEEERALRKIELTKERAQKMMDNKAHKGDLEEKRLAAIRERISEVREKVNMRRNEKDMHAMKLLEHQVKTIKHAAEVRAEREMITKRMAKKDKSYLRRAQEKRFEQ